MKIKVSIVIASWNGSAYIKNCLQSVFRQKQLDFVKQDVSFSPNQDDEEALAGYLAEVIVIDNGSQDGTVQIIENDFAKRVTLVRQRHNLGFAAAYNRGIHWSRGEYVLILNQDVVLNDDYLSLLIPFLDTYEKIGVVIGRTMRCLYPFKPTRIVDSLGLAISHNFQISNIGAGKKYRGDNKEAVPVFGFSGAVALLRRQALNDVMFANQFFDEDFVSYKEDVDLSWRLRWRNWDIVYVPEAVAYHHRSIQEGQDKKSDLSIAKHYLAKPDFINFLSYRNHLFVLIKNLPVFIWLRYFFPISFYEFKKAVFLLVLKPTILLKAWRDVIIKMPSFLLKRRYILSQKKIKTNAIKLWIK